MEIYHRLPPDIQQKMFQYFRHPIAQQLHNYPWIIPQIINQWPPAPTAKHRLALARMVMNPTPLDSVAVAYIMNSIKFVVMIFLKRS